LAEGIIKLFLADLTAIDTVSCRILCCSQSGEHSEKRLGANWPNLAIESRKKESFYILGYLLELSIKICLFKKRIPLMGELGFFSP